MKTKLRPWVIPAAYIVALASISISMGLDKGFSVGLGVFGIGILIGIYLYWLNN